METLLTRNGERVTALRDYLFLKVMGEKGDEEQLLAFLNAVLGRTGENQFVSVEIMEGKSLVAETMGLKSGVLDLRAVLPGGTIVNVEVQLSNDHDMDKRSLFYWSKLFVNSLKKGQNYEELPRVIAINIINFEFFAAGDYHTRFHLWEDKDEILMTDVLEIHYLDMVKWRGGKRKRHSKRTFAPVAVMV